MEKRLPLALFLSFLVFMTWTLLAPHPKKPSAPPAGAPTDSSESAPQTAEAPAPGEEAGEEPVEKTEAEATPPSPALSEPVAETEERTLEVRVGAFGHPGCYRALFSNRGARLLELRLGDFFDRGDLSEAERSDSEHWMQLLAPFETPKGETASLEFSANPSAADLLRGTPLEQALWKMEPLAEEGQTVGVDFSYDPGSGVLFHKRVRFVADAHTVEVELGLENLVSPLSGERSFRFTPANVVPRSSIDRYYVEPRAAAAWRSAGARVPDLAQQQRKDAPGRDLTGALGGTGAFCFGGVHSKYFAFLLHPDPDDPQAAAAVQGARYRRLFDSVWGRAHPGATRGGWEQVVCDLDLSLYLPEPGKSVVRRFEIFAGPKDHDVLVGAWPEHQVLVDKDLGMFSAVAKIILGILGVYEGLIGNWGWAIILMTLTVRLLLFPVNRRSQTSMARYQTKMKRVQPKLDELKKRHEKDPSKLRQEQARIMQEEGAFPPLGGCLPIFLQMPVFIGLYQALRVDFDLRHAPFMLWIRDLSMPDRLMTLGVTGLPVLGDMLQYLNVLPILMIVLWVVQQRTMPKPSDEQQARMQKMMVWMPVLFGVMLYNYASGLSLYMITSSSLGIFETRVIKKFWPVDDKERPRKKSAFALRLQEMQKQAQRAQNPRRGPGGKGKRGGK